MDLFVYYSFVHLFKHLDKTVIILALLSAQNCDLEAKLLALGILSCTKVNYVAIMHYVR